MLGRKIFYFNNFKGVISDSQILKSMYTVN